MTPTTSLAAIAVASMVRGGARKAAVPPPPPDNLLEKTYKSYMETNEPLRFFISGNIGNVVFFYIEKAIYSMLQRAKNLPPIIEDYMDNVSFFVSYLLQVIPQHWLHAFLVYGMHTIDTKAKYFRTLGGCYSAYTMSLIGSTLLNMFFLNTCHMPKNISFVVTLWSFAIINYFFITWIISSSAETPKQVVDARQAARDAKRNIQKAKQESMAKAKMVEAKMKAKAELAKQKANALEEKLKAKAELDKQREREKQEREKKLELAKKEREKQLKEKERQMAQQRAERERARNKTQIKEVGNKAAVKTRGGACNVSLQTCLESKEALDKFVCSVGPAIEVE